MSSFFKKNDFATFLKFVKDSDIDEADFDAVRDLIRDSAGINLTGNRKLMVQTRLSRRIKELGLAGIKEYLDHIKNNSFEINNFVNALTTNKTELFRESDHFDYLQNIYCPSLTSDENRSKSINVWSAACSTGDEAYTIAIVLHAFAETNVGFDFKVLGTDIDTSIIEKAKLGIYMADQIEVVPIGHLKGNFMRGKGQNEGLYKIADRIRQKIYFERFNLIDPLSRIEDKFDVIFLRNVLIYFEKKIIELVVKRVISNLKIGGLFFIGHSELLDDTEREGLELVQTSIYRKIW